MIRLFRIALRATLVFLFLFLLLIGIAAIMSPDVDSPVPQYSAEEIAEIEDLRDVTQGFDNPPVIQREVDYSEGSAAAWWPKGEPDFLKELVAEGAIDPVEKRVGSEPVVLESPDGIGQYGGTWHRLVTSEYDAAVIGWRIAGNTLARWSPLGYPIVPHVAKGWEHRDEGREWIVYLRKGMRWSDGHPFTAKDILFWWEKDALHFKTVPIVLITGGETAQVDALDDYTVRFRFKRPCGVFPVFLAQQHNFALPEHYLGPLHPDFGDAELIKRLCAERRVSSPRALYTFLRNWSNPECPRLWPWVPRTDQTQAPYNFVRNPYYFAVDPQGNQLPYIDRVAMAMKQGKMITVAAASGEVSMQVRHLGFNDYTLFMSNRKANNFDVYHWYSASRSPAAIFGNTNRSYKKVDLLEIPLIDAAGAALDASTAVGKTLYFGVLSKDEKQILSRRNTVVTAENLEAWRQAGVPKITIITGETIDPIAKMKHDLLNQVEFRRAMSLALNREEIIQVEFLDREALKDSVLSRLVYPAQLDPGAESPFHSPLLIKADVEFDPNKAKALLDQIGLTNRDSEGMRTFRDGTRMNFYLYTTSDYFPNVGITALMIEHWAEIGVRVTLRDRARPLFNAERSSLVHDFVIWTGESEFNPLSSGKSFVPLQRDTWQSPGYGIWQQFGGHQDNPLVQQRPAALEPPADHPLYKAIMTYQEMMEAVDEKEQVRLFRRITDEYCAPYAWSMGICTPPPQPVVVDRNMRGVSRNALVGAALSTPANAAPEIFWFVEDRNSPDARASIKRDMTQVRLNVAASTDSGNVATTRGKSGAGQMILLLLIGSLFLGLLLAGLRHPFVLRRLLIMIPTLLVISVVVYVIIQLPPGDFLENRIMELQLMGDEVAAQNMQELRKLFHTEESEVMRYFRWMGFPWFLSFKNQDRGLLQGDLGRSMENSKLVNEIVGDRILLTVAISLATILFTWVVALSIGIYSAVRQYSWMDYSLTALGFIGMSVPGFLLALLCMHWANVWFGVSVTGLFSPDYADEPWSWGKFVDLLQHIWLPILILGIGGTAGMIRVMRANLLDELKKPYVITAMAKGVKPARLLFRYPVRIALNPFISGIGHLFPALVSGGAIVAMVLSLPTVGPQMIYALQNEDMYLAGSMLMILSLLGVFGTLVSDLLLLWLDPRVRMEGGQR